MTPDRLRHHAARGEMIPGAPVRACAEATIAAPVEIVWTLMTDVPRWPTWYPYLKNAELGGGFMPGSPLRYGGLVKHRLVIAMVQDRKTITVCGRMLIYDGITRWDFRATAEGWTTVTFTESSAGPMLGLLYSAVALRRHLREWLVALKVEAETRPLPGVPSSMPDD